MGASLKRGILFTKGFANLWHAMSDIRRADVAGEFSLVCSHSQPDFVGFPAADIALKEPSGGLGLFLQTVVHQHNIKVVIASQNQTIANACKPALAQLGAQVVTIGNNSLVATVNNKARLYRALANDSRFAIPAFKVARTSEQLFSAISSMEAQFERLCLKPVTGVYGSGFRVLRNAPLSLKDVLSEEKVIDKSTLRQFAETSFPEPFLVMQYLEGDERSVDCLAQEGRLIAAVIRRKSAKAGRAQVIETNPALLETCSAMVAKLGLNGLFNIQFKDSGGVHYLLEVNPRMSGRSYYATVAGVNLPYLAAQLFSGLRTADELSFSVASEMAIGNVTSPVVLAPKNQRWDDSFASQGSLDIWTPESI